MPDTWWALTNYCLIESLSADNTSNGLVGAEYFCLILANSKHKALTSLEGDISAEV